MDKLGPVKPNANNMEDFFVKSGCMPNNLVQSIRPCQLFKAF